MLIYKDEKDIADQILKANILAYEANVELISPSEVENHKRVLAAFKETPNTPDLFFTKSIMVSSSLNKNDDYFDRYEIWAARHTPVDKPMNIDHDHNKIVGHITSSWGVDDDMNILEDNLAAEELPDFIHICISSVVYKKWQDEALQAQADQLIEDIQNGEYSVSMEAMFTSFDYLLTKGEESNIVKRDDTTSFLTKKLRCYGGEGTYEGYKVGRVIRNPIFSATAFTKRPANPDSIIFAKSLEKNKKIPKIISDTGVYLKCTERINMSDILEKQITELKEQVKLLTTANKELGDELASASVEKFESEITSLKEQLASATKALADEQAKSQAVEAAKTIVADELKALKEKFDAVSAELTQLKDETVSVARVAQLMEAGLSKEDAQAKVKTLVALSADQFNDIVSIIASVKPAETPAPKTEVTEEAKAEEAESELSTASEEEGEVDATVSETDDNSELMAAFAAHYEGVFAKKERK